MTVKEVMSQLEKADPDDTVMVDGKDEFAIEIVNSDKTVCFIGIC